MNNAADDLVALAFRRFCQSSPSEPSLSSSRLRAAASAALGRVPSKRGLVESVHRTDPSWIPEASLSFTHFAAVCADLRLNDSPSSGFLNRPAGSGHFDASFGALDRKKRGFFTQDDLEMTVAEVAPTLSCALSPVLFDRLDTFDLGKITHKQFRDLVDA